MHPEIRSLRQGPLEMSWGFLLVLVVGTRGDTLPSAFALGRVTGLHPGERVEGGSVQPCREGLIFLFLWNVSHRDM